MANVANSYCELNDLRKGDLPLPSFMADGSQFLVGAAQEIDAQLGHIYQTPFIVDPPDSTMKRPAVLLLRKINWLIGSGRLILDLAASGENTELHAYGKRMLDEGMLLLMQIANGEIILSGAPFLEPEEGETEEGIFTGPIVVNEDEQSLVQGFYDRFNYTQPWHQNPVDPYAGARE